MKNNKENERINLVLYDVIILFGCVIFFELIGNIFNIEFFKILTGEYHRYQFAPAALLAVLIIIVIDKIKKRKR